MKPKRNSPDMLAAARCYAAPLDLTHPDANMYGCFPCPICKSIFRWPTQQGTVRCDDCGLVQELEKTEQHKMELSDPAHRTGRLQLKRESRVR